MDEEILSYVWENRLFRVKKLQTTCGKSLTIRHPGHKNADSGPDFQLSRLNIESGEWVGQVEIHVKSSDWFKHGHQNDEAYRGLILHVVWEHDKDIPQLSEAGVHTLELQNFIDPLELERCYELLHSLELIPCKAEQAKDILVKTQWLDRMLAERLENKSVQILQTLDKCGNDWQEVLYRCIARAFGLKVNVFPFEMLSTILPYRLLARNRGYENRLEALIFGQSGFLHHQLIDQYPQHLRQEYLNLAKAYALESMPVSNWKFLRMHPNGFPTLRLAQFAQLLRNVHPLTDLISITDNLDELTAFFTSKPHPYWDDHYRFDKAVSPFSSRMGTDTASMIIINAMIPFIFTYGKSRHDQDLQNKAIAMLELIPAESNKITRMWSSLDLKVSSASDSQALIHAYSNYCSSKKCLSCTLGRTRLKITTDGIKNSGVF